MKDTFFFISHTYQFVKNNIVTQEIFLKPLNLSYGQNVYISNNYRHYVLKYSCDMQYW